jgi:hypothetical protein
MSVTKPLSPGFAGERGRGEGEEARPFGELPTVPASPNPLTPTLSPAKPGEREQDSREPNLKLAT